MRKLTQEEFLKRAREIHGGKYDYSKAKYMGSDTKVIIICPEHGEFLQTPHRHLTGDGCPKCSLKRRADKRKLPMETFLKRANEAHHYKYDYKLVEYNNEYDKIDIICPTHGVFQQTMKNHMNGHGCPKCGNIQGTLKQRKPQEQFIKEANEIHDGFYDYSLVKYKGQNVSVTIICPNHGPFEQIPKEHLNGHGCPSCAESQLEKQIRKLLKNKNIQFEKEYKFEWLKNPNTSYYLPLDFYLPKQKIAIECHGKQHFEPIEFFGGQNSFDSLCERDDIMNQLCKERGIEIFYFAEDEDYIKNYRYTIFSSIEELIKRIETM